MHYQVIAKIEHFKLSDSMWGMLLLVGLQGIVGEMYTQWFGETLSSPIQGGFLSKPADTKHAWVMATQALCVQTPVPNGWWHTQLLLIMVTHPIVAP